MSLDRVKIQNALACLHHYEKNEGRLAAYKRAVRILALNDAECGVLRRAVNIREDEVSQ